MKSAATSLLLFLGLGGTVCLIGLVVLVPHVFGLLTLAGLITFGLCVGKG